MWNGLMIKKTILSTLVAATMINLAHASTSSLAKGVEIYEAFKCSIIPTGNLEEQERLFNAGMAAGYEFCNYMDSLDPYNWPPGVSEAYMQLPPEVVLSKKGVSCDFLLGQIYSAAVQEVFRGADPKHLLNYPMWQQRYQAANCYYVGR